MRQIVLDTETTGIEIREGNRILEIGCVELDSRQLTGNNLHLYINPERDSEEGALRVHGITTEFLQDKPKFAEIAQQFCDYVKGAEVIIHNASFDVGFLNEEFRRAGLPPFTDYVGNVIDSLSMAREIFPGRRNSLDALCERFDISNAHRTLHGALLDAELLADVYLAMTRGQNNLLIDEEESHEQEGTQSTKKLMPLEEVIVVSATADEMAAHDQVLKEIDKESRGKCLWKAEEVAEEKANETAAA